MSELEDKRHGIREAGTSGGGLGVGEQTEALATLST